MSLLKSNGFGYVSFFVVKKEERGSGVGLTLFRKAMETQMDVNSVLISGNFRIPKLKLRNKRDCRIPFFSSSYDE